MLVWGKRRTILTRSGEGVEMSGFISFPILQPFLSEHSSSARTGRGGAGGKPREGDVSPQMLTRSW